MLGNKIFSYVDGSAFGFPFARVFGEFRMFPCSTDPFLDEQEQRERDHDLIRHKVQFASPMFSKALMPGNFPDLLDGQSMD
jgi:hypothetical protein